MFDKKVLFILYINNLYITVFPRCVLKDKIQKKSQIKCVCKNNFLIFILDLDPIQNVLTKMLARCYPIEESVSYNTDSSIG